MDMAFVMGKRKQARRRLLGLLHPFHLSGRFPFDCLLSFGGNLAEAGKDLGSSKGEERGVLSKKQYLQRWT
jgi:hypothetical protein